VFARVASSFVTQVPPELETAPTGPIPAVVLPLEPAGAPADDSDAGAVDEPVGTSAETPAGLLHVTRTGDGPSVVLLHGFTQSARSWGRLEAALAPGHELVMPDLPGHGDSPPATGGLGEAAALVGDSCGAGSYVGYSLGGRVALHLALARPELVERLVLVGTTAGIEDLYEREERKDADDKLADELTGMGEQGLAGFLDEWLAGPLFAHLTEDQADRESRLANSAYGLASALRHLGTGTQLPVWEEVGMLQMPVLVVAGDADAKFVDAGQRLASAIGRNAVFVLAPNCGHAVPFEQPDAFVALVRAFVAGETGPT
jgi:2-succinyl-6-hydroxy-2,4-cyclohexadiene-1-carboxylate synthase